MTSEPQLPRVGDLIDRGKYRIDALIGEGGMGAVFAATHMQMGGRRRAIKWLLPKLARDENAVRRFLAEANIAARIDHPNVVSPIDVSVDTGAPYIVMELLQGQTLADYLGEQSLPLERAGRIFMPILQGVAAAHDQNIVHRDLKPGNIFLVRSGHGAIPKVLDFGIAKLIDPRHTAGTLTDQGALLGTIHYMSPEQLRDAREVGPQTDVYALGVILYRMLSGKLPYDGNLLDLALRIREGRPVPLGLRVQTLPAGFEEVVMRALSPSLERRYADVRSFAHALSPYFPGHGLDFGPALHPSQPSPISAMPPAQPRPVDDGRLVLRESPIPAENSTFHPIATRSQTSRGSRAWLLGGVIGLAVIAAGLFAVWSSRGERADGDTKPDDSIAKPEVPADPKVAAAGQPPARPEPVRVAEEPPKEAAPAGWNDLGVVDPPRPAADDAPPEPEVAEPTPTPPRARTREQGSADPSPRSRRPVAAAPRGRSTRRQQDAGAASPGESPRSPLDTILEQNSDRLDTILDTGSPKR
jgi:serine/threonine-protein kinase